MRAYVSKLAASVVPGAHLVDIIPALNYLPESMAKWKREGMRWHEEESERIEALTRLRRSEFPDNFAKCPNYGDCGEDVQALLRKMVCANEEDRLTCANVQVELRRLIQRLRTYATYSRTFKSRHSLNCCLKSS